jgi:hypothetical protein
VDVDVVSLLLVTDAVVVELVLDEVVTELWVVVEPVEVTEVSEKVELLDELLERVELVLDGVVVVEGVVELVEMHDWHRIGHLACSATAMSPDPTQSPAVTNLHVGGSR